jgi:hypothetical protein
MGTIVEQIWNHGKFQEYYPGTPQEYAGKKKLVRTDYNTYQFDDDYRLIEVEEPKFPPTLTVGELIEKLEEFDPSLPCVLSLDFEVKGVNPRLIEVALYVDRYPSYSFVKTNSSEPQRYVNRQKAVVL